MSVASEVNNTPGAEAGLPINFSQNSDQTATGRMDGMPVSLARPPAESPNPQQTEGLFGNSRDKANDGLLLGGDGRSYPPGTRLSDIAGVKPDNGQPETGKTVLYVNGIMTDAAAQRATMQRIANQTGAGVIGVHNATEGFAADIAQSARDKLNNGYNPPVNTLSSAVYDSIKNRQDVNIVAHSQGGLIVSRAIRDVSDRLRGDGYSNQEVENMLRQYVNVQTFGAAAGHYPDGPNYRHVINVKDIVPGLFGLTGDTPVNTPIFHAGKDARIERFSSDLSPANIVGNHSIDDLYMRYIDPNLFK